MDVVFKALADASRRELLDRLRADNGQTLNELCARLDMTRQAVSKHLAILEGANLVATVRRGREKLHYLNPVPIHEIEERWISGFEKPRLRALSAIKNLAEEQGLISTMTENATGTASGTSPVPDYVYVTYIRATDAQVWQTLTDADLTARFWGHANISDWQPGSSWEHRRVDGSGVVDVVGRVLEAEPPTRLVITFDDVPDPESPREPSVVTFLIEPYQDIVRLTVTHEKLPNAEMFGGISQGWPAVLANLKSLLETGDVLLQAPWEMHGGHE